MRRGLERERGEEHRQQISPQTQRSSTLDNIRNNIALIVILIGVGAVGYGTMVTFDTSASMLPYIITFVVLLVLGLLIAPTTRKRKNLGMLEDDDK